MCKVSGVIHVLRVKALSTLYHVNYLGIMIITYTVFSQNQIRYHTSVCWSWLAKSAAATSTSAPVLFVLRLVTLWWLIGCSICTLGLVNQLAYIIYTFENRQTDPKPAHILSTRPSQYLPAQSNSKPPNWAGTCPIWQQLTMLLGNSPWYIPHRNALHLTTHF